MDPSQPAAQMLTPAKAGMIAFLVSEAAFFCTLLVAYVVFLGKSTTGPTPGGVLSLRLVIATTICLLASSITVHLAVHAHDAGDRTRFVRWWLLTMALGAAFLLGTAYEWYELIGHCGLTMSRNLFGTTYFTLVGFHAAHVTVGVLLMAIVLGQTKKGEAPIGQGAQLVSWYWHFVDGVWVVVFTLVYLIGR